MRQEYGLEFILFQKALNSFYFITYWLSVKALKMHTPKCLFASWNLECHVIGPLPAYTHSVNYDISSNMAM